MARKNKGDRKVLTESQIHKKYGSGTAAQVTLTPDSLLRIPSRVIGLNHQLNGGIPYGKILELFGEESTGKSLLATDFAYCTQALGGEVLWADAENSFDRYWMEQNGIDLSRVQLLPQTTSIEKISDWVLHMIKAVRLRLTNNQPILLVIDSVGAMRCSKDIEESAVDASAKFGNRARALSDMLGNRSELLGKLGISTIFINQLRKKIGATKWEDPDKTVGGDALKFYAHQRIGLVKGKQIKWKVKGIEYKVGQNIYVRTKKDKTGPPRETTNTKVYFRKSGAGNIGFDKYFGLPELLVQKGVLERRKGSSMYYYKESMVARGEDSMMEKLMGDQELRSKLIKKSGINTISQVKAKIEALTTNLFPVPQKAKRASSDDSAE